MGDAHDAFGRGHHLDHGFLIGLASRLSVDIHANDNEDGFSNVLSTSNKPSKILDVFPPP
jgi:hypothetical protein